MIWHTGVPVEQHWSVSCRVYSNLIRICNNDWARHWHISYHSQWESCEVFKFHSEIQIYQIEGLRQNGPNSLEITKINSPNQIFTFFQVTKNNSLFKKKGVIICPLSWVLFLVFVPVDEESLYFILCFGRVLHKRYEFSGGIWAVCSRKVSLHQRSYHNSCSWL